MYMQQGNVIYLSKPPLKSVKKCCQPDLIWLKAEELKKHKYRPNKPLTEDQVNVMGRYLFKYGLFYQIVVDENNVILGGHHLFQQYRSGSVLDIPVFQLKQLSKSKKAAFQAAYPQYNGGER